VHQQAGRELEATRGWNPRCIHPRPRVARPREGGRARRALGRFADLRLADVDRPGHRARGNRPRRCRGRPHPTGSHGGSGLGWGRSRTATRCARATSSSHSTVSPQKSMKSEIAYELEPVTGFRASRVVGTAIGARRCERAERERTRDQARSPVLRASLQPRRSGLAPIPLGVYGGSTAGLNTSPVGNGAVQGRERDGRIAGGARAQRHLRRHQGVPRRHQVPRRIEHRRCMARVPGPPGRISPTCRPARSPAGRASISVGSRPCGRTLSFAPNLKLAKYQDPNVRIAMSLAIDRATIHVASLRAARRTPQPVSFLEACGAMYPMRARRVPSIKVARARCSIRRSKGRSRRSRSTIWVTRRAGS